MCSGDHETFTFAPPPGSFCRSASSAFGTSTVILTSSGSLAIRCVQVAGLGEVSARPSAVGVRRPAAAGGGLLGRAAGGQGAAAWGPAAAGLAGKALSRRNWALAAADL